MERDLEAGILSESEAQELIDHMVMKFRMVKFARIPAYNELFSGDPVWATLEVAGMGSDGRSLVTKNDFRFLHTLENMGPSPEPNLTVLYSSRLPETFRKYAAKISVNTSSIQYENDDVMIIAFVAAYRRLKQGKKCNSLELVRTWRRLCCMPSMVV